MCLICIQELIYAPIPWYQNSCYHGEAWTDNRQGKSFPAATGEAPSDLSHWPDGFRWFVTVVDQGQCRIRAWAEHYRSLDQVDSTQGALSLLD